VGLLRRLSSLQVVKHILFVRDEMDLGQELMKCEGKHVPQFPNTTSMFVAM
jgi:hypothetical protein